MLQETEGGHNLTLFIPENMMEMLVLAAQAQGWTTKIINQQGQEVDNPISAPMQVLINAIQQAAQYAANQLAQQQMDAIRNQAREQMGTMRDQWIAQLRGEG